MTMNKIMRERAIDSLTMSIIVLLLFFTVQTSSAQEKSFYRYKNENGIETIQNSIPPEFIQYGYDIISAQGSLIETVPPAPSKQEIARQKKELELFEQFRALKKRYSNLDEIESARQRRVASIRINAGVLKGNVTSLKDQIDSLTKKAAQYERDERNVPKHISEKIESSQAELKIIDDLLQVREAELEKVNQKFDHDIKLFSDGEQLLKKLLDKHGK